MNFDELISKYKKLVRDEYAKYSTLGDVELDKEEITKNPYVNLLFDRSDVGSYHFSTLQGLEEVPSKIAKQLKDTNRPYYDLSVAPHYSSVNASCRLLKSKYYMDNFLDYDHNKYEFKRQFTQIVKIEMGIQYMTDIDCAVLNMYRNAIISLDQLIQSVKSC